MSRSAFRFLLTLLAVGMVGPGRAEPEITDRRPQKLLLGEGWWRGVVKLATGPSEFFMEVRGTTVGEAEIVMHSEAQTVRLNLLTQLDQGRELIVYGNRAGESMEGRLSGGAWFGRYRVNAHGAAQEGGQVFSFWAERTDPWDELPPGRVWNLSGTWLMSLGPGETRSVHLAHFDRRLRGYWAEPGADPVYLSGRIEDGRFRLEGWRSPAVLEGHYEAGGVLRGEFTDARGRLQTYSMRRNLPAGDGLRVAATP